MTGVSSQYNKTPYGDFSLGVECFGRCTNCQTEFRDSDGGIEGIIKCSQPGNPGQPEKKVARVI